MGFTDKQAFYMNVWMNKEEMWKYQSMPGNAWWLLCWYYNFNRSGTMKSLVRPDGIYYWLNYSYVVKNMGMVDLSTVRKVRYALDKIVESGIFKKHIEIVDGVSAAYFMPTERFMPIFSVDRDAMYEHNGGTIEAPVHEEASLPPAKKEKEVHVFDTRLHEFYQILMSSGDRFKQHKKPVDGEVPRKLWLDTEAYLLSILDGTFLEKYCQSIEGAPKSMQDMDLEQIAKAVHECPWFSKTNISINGAFITTKAGGKVVSPFLQYIAKKLPVAPAISQEEISTYRIKYPDLFSSNPEKAYRSVTRFVGKVEGLVMDDPRIYKLMDKFVEYFDEDTLSRLPPNCGTTFQPLRVKCLPVNFLKMVMENHTWAEKYRKSLNDWLAEMVIGRPSYAWKAFCRAVYKDTEFFITEDKDIIRWIKDKKREELNRNYNND